MNFKLTKDKLIVASILALIVGAYKFWGLTWKGPSPENYLQLKFMSGITGLPLAFVLTYVIYSLIEKKK